MTRRIVSIIALTSMCALQGLWVSTAHAGDPNPGEGAGGPAGKPPGHGPGAKPGLGNQGKPDLGALKDRLDKGSVSSPQDRAAKLKERAAQLRKEGREKQAEALEKQAERLASGKPGEPGAGTSPANKEKIKEARKLARVKLLQRRYGESLKETPVRDEVEVHARRSANLSRMKALVGARPEADEKQKEAKQKLVERINRLMARENARHSRQMAKLTKQQDKLAKEPTPAAPKGEAPAEKKEKAEK